MKRNFNRLPQVACSILLALSLKPRHGYEIIKQIKLDSDGRISVAPGALYISLKKSNERGFIEELSEEQDGRRYYRLTDAGRKALGGELKYYQSAVELGRQRQILTTEAL